MFDIAAAIEKGNRGEDVDPKGVFDYLSGFDHIVLRGAGSFGLEIGRLLLERGIPKGKFIYWDLRATDLGEVNGIKVSVPYQEKLDKNRTLVVNCIPNGVFAGRFMEEELKGNGYPHHISGMGLYETLFCPMRVERGFDSKFCLTAKACNWCCCERLMSILKKECGETRPYVFDDELDFRVLTFVINQDCTLNCKHCGQHINCFPKEERVNFPLERIKKDIDKFLDAVDAVGFVSIIGGEPFLHPDLNRIVEHLLEKRNFGMLGITTNGICKISSEHLAMLQNDRTRLIFSDYTAVLTHAQKRLFNENVSKVKDAGINFTVGVPIWVMPPSLSKTIIPEEVKISMKGSCQSIKTCPMVQNGAYYPCTTVANTALFSLASYSLDYVLVDDAGSAVELRKRIKQVNDRAFYQSCDFCAGTGEPLPCSGEQGFDERYATLLRKG